MTFDSDKQPRGAKHTGTHFEIPPIKWTAGERDSAILAQCFPFCAGAFFRGDPVFSQECVSMRPQNSNCGGLCCSKA